MLIPQNHIMNHTYIFNNQLITQLHLPTSWERNWKPHELQKNLLPSVFKSFTFSIPIPIFLTDPLLDARGIFHPGKMHHSKKRNGWEACLHFFLQHERATVRRQLKENLLERCFLRWTSFRQDYGNLGLRKGFLQNQLCVPYKVIMYQFEDLRSKGHTIFSLILVS